MSDRDDSKTPTPEDRADKVYPKTGNTLAWRDPSEARKMRGDMDADQLVVLRRKVQWGELITTHK